MRHYLSFADGTDLDVSAICNSIDTLIKAPLCTTDFTSAASSAQFTLKYAPGTAYDPVTGTPINKTALYKTAISKITAAIYNKEEVRVIIRSSDKKTVMFRGYLNASNFNLDVAKIPEDAVVSCKDYTTDMDKVIGQNLVFENKPINEIVETLYSMCYSDSEHVYVGAGETVVGFEDDDTQVILGTSKIISVLPNSRIVTPFVIKEEDKKTYRQVIDTLLLEVPGYVLHYLHNSNRFEIVPSIPPAEVGETPRQIHFKVNDRVKLQTGVYSHDGIQLNWPTIHEEDDVNVYSESIDIKYQEDKYIGQMLGYMEFFPSDGDITKTEQQFRMADRDYATGVSRLQNKDLSLLYARDCRLDISSLDINVTNKGAVADLDELEAITNQKIGDYYTVTDIDGEGTVGYRVWDGSKWHTTDQMSLTNGIGNKYVYMGEVPSKSDLPTTSTEGYWYAITGSTEAWVWEDGVWCRKYSQFALPVLANLEGMVDNPMWYPGKMWTLLQNRSGGLVNLQSLSVRGHAVWRDKLNKTTEPETIKNPEEYDATYIFDQTAAEAFALWLYNAKKIACTTVQWTEPETMPVRSKLGERVKVKFFDGFEAVFCVIQINDKGLGKDLREYQCTAVLVEGFASENTGSTESTQTGIQPSKTIIDVSEVYASTDDGVNPPSVWSPSRIVEKGKYLWTKITTTYSDGTRQESVSVVYNGDDGESAEVFRFKLSQETYLRNKRSSGNNPAITLTADIQGITATPYWFADYGSGYTYLGTGSTYSLTIPMNNSYDTVKLGMGNASSWASSTKKFELSISVIDQTQYGSFLGATTRANVSGMVYEAGRPRDYYVDITDGNTYEYDGSTPWVLSTDINKLMFALDTLTRIPGVDLSNYQDPNTVSQFNTIIALKVIVRNLFSQFITLLNGGCIHSEYYDDNGNPRMTATIAKTYGGRDISVALDIEAFLAACEHTLGEYSWVCDDTQDFWDRQTGNTLSSKSTAGLADYGITITGTPSRYDKITVSVISETETARGFWLGSDGLLKCHAAEARDLSITGKGFFQGTFDCDVIKTVSVNPTITGTYSASPLNAQAKTLLNAFPSNVKPDYPSFPGKPSNWSDYIPVQMTTPLGDSTDIVYVRLRREWLSNRKKIDGVYLYGRSRNQLSVKDYFNVSDPNNTRESLSTTSEDGVVTDGFYATTTVTIQTIEGGNVLEVNIPSEAQTGSLTHGQLYYDSSGYVRMKI